MKILLQYLKNYKGLIALALFLAAVSQVFSLLDPHITGKIVDNFLNRKGDLPRSEFVKGILYLVGLAIGAAMVSRIAKNLQDYFTSIFVQKLGAKMYADGLRHSLELPYQTFEDQRSGETLGILQKVRTDCEKFITAFITILFSSVVGLIFISIYALTVSYKVALVYFAAVPVIALTSWLLSRKIKVVQKNIVKETTSLAGSTTESLRNIELVKSLGLANQEIERLNNTTFKILGLELKKVKYVRSMSFLQGTTVNFVRSVMVVILLILIFDKEISDGKYFTFLFYSFFLFGPLQEIGNVIIAYREAEVSLFNFNRILSLQKEVVPKNPVAIAKISTLTFQGVSFKHQSANTNALNDISFSTEKGETIAFVGPSGSGKTTLVKLLVGLYPPKDGEILYNNVSSADINLNALREKIGFVTQDTQLFSGTIRENLLFVRPSATDEECFAVLQKAACQSLLARADKGLDTVIGEGGVKVSGGEKQRLSIARALLRQPDLLVFDEATSSLDSLTEEEITETIRDVSTIREHITILIAHRLSTIMHADKIFVLERGKIIESGKHETLLQEKGLYYAMWRQQIGEKDAVEV
ncbi:ABC transporter ATP-binding protein [Pseudochryseolinea flava]|uniref:ABC transporter ATP-binding protein n=1 Tax=Pseudochryseolinea flava TaxID=2059302 RepID=A0A364Y1T1_9BACT|nr:ABC transporter ATP-binding protein [Pseudochryseolinea flava]RAW00833.1 ABC transporter ATP-binding protein [Pseudochryseolinea flava]